jgi:hypothetical protein
MTLKYAPRVETFNQIRNQGNVESYPAQFSKVRKSHVPSTKKVLNSGKRACSGSNVRAQERLGSVILSHLNI